MLEKKYANLMNKHVEVAGTLQTLPIGGHHTPAMMDVLDISPERVKGNNTGCLEGEPAIEKITGLTYKKTFPGPPNYESIKQGDMPETRTILKLDNPICIIMPDMSDITDKSVMRDIKEVSLFFPENDVYKKYKRLKHKRVLVTGEIWAAYTGHHHTPILITVLDISPAKRPLPARYLSRKTTSKPSH
jgi:hypothetical protein